MWVHVTLAIWHVWHLCTPWNPKTVLCVLCRDPPYPLHLWFTAIMWPLSSPGSPTCADLWDACIRCETAYLLLLPNQSFLTSLIENIIKENWKQKCKVLFDRFWKKQTKKNPQTKQNRAGVVSYPYLWPWHAWTLSVDKPAVSSLSLSNGRIVNMNWLDNVTVTQRENSKWWRDSKRERGEQKKDGT